MRSREQRMTGRRHSIPVVCPEFLFFLIASTNKQIKLTYNSVQRSVDVFTEKGKGAVKIVTRVPGLALSLSTK